MSVSVRNKMSMFSLFSRVCVNTQKEKVFFIPGSVTSKPKMVGSKIDSIYDVKLFGKNWQLVRQILSSAIECLLLR